MKNYAFFLLSLVLLVTHLDAAQPFEILPYPLYKPNFALDHKEINTYLRFQNLNNEISDEGKIGMKVPLLGYGPLQLTTAAFIRIWMYPENMKFHVDRFLAGLALGFDYKINSNLHISIYPMFHESAHLADGYKGNINDDCRTVSVESAQLKLWFEKGIIQIPFRFDYYWHAIGPDWKYEAGTGVRLALPIWRTRAGLFLLEISGFGYLVSGNEGMHLNGEFQEGLLLKNGERKLRLSFHYGYEYGSGQDWQERQRSWGLNVGFEL